MFETCRPIVGAAVAAALLVSPAALAESAAEPFDHARLSRLEVGERALLEGIVLEADLAVALDVERFEVVAPGGVVVLGTAGGDRPMPPTDLVLLRGTIVGEDEDSTVFVSVGRWGVHGFVDRAGELYSMSTGPYAGLLGPNRPVTISAASALPVALDGGGVGCGVTAGDPRFYGPFADDGVLAPSPASPRLTGTSRGTECGLALMAIDTDWEFTGNLFGGNAAASADYALTLLAGVSSIYERDVDVAMMVNYLRVWDADVDPYGGEAEMGAFLDRFRNHWRTQMGSVQRVVAHGLSGRGLGGGVAYVNVLCSNNWGYGVSTSLGGSFPMPMVDHSHGNWDPFVVAHELGHNFGTGHTHDSYDPVIDGCGIGDCSAAWGGTIMSYCHGCPGGMSNIVLGFHPRVQQVIEATVGAAGCFTPIAGGSTAIDDRVDTIAGNAITIHALVNDVEQSCGTPTIMAIQSPTPAGGTATIVTGGALDRIRYTPAAGFNGQDAFTYTLDGGATASVTVGVHTLRAPDQPSDPTPGVRVDYYALTSPTVLPDFDALSPIMSTTVSNINFPPSTGLFANGPFANNVGSVFRGYVRVLTPGLYHFEIESDDGSMLQVGDMTLIDNDGVHGMRAMRGVVGLLPGLHRVRVEFFEASGEAGLIVRSGLTTGGDPVVIPASSWFFAHDPECEADINGDGLLDFFDVQAFLNRYSSGDEAADFNGDGATDFFDVQSYLNAFAAGCP